MICITDSSGGVLFEDDEISLEEANAIVNTYGKKNEKYYIQVANSGIILDDELKELIEQYYTKEEIFELFLVSSLNITTMLEYEIKPIVKKASLKKFEKLLLGIKETQIDFKDTTFDILKR